MNETGSSVLRVEESGAKYLVSAESALMRNFESLATASAGLERLRSLVLSLAVRGKLVSQDSRDESAAALLSHTSDEKRRLFSNGTIRREFRRGNPELDAHGLPSGWRLATLDDLCTVVTDGDHLPPPKVAYGIPFLVIGDVRSGRINLSSAERFVSPEYFSALDWSRRPKAGDVLYTTVGSFGIPVAVTRDEDFCFQRHIALLRPGVQLLQPYLHVALKSPQVFDQARVGATGIAQKTVSLAVLRSFSIPLPPLAEQHRIVARVEELMKLCDALEQSGRLADEQHARLTSTLFDALAASESAHALAENWQRVAEHFDLLLDRPEAVDALEEALLQLAVRGVLVPQERTDESGAKLLNRIQRSRAAKRKLVTPNYGAGAIPDDRLPHSWTWASIDEISADGARAITDGPFGANLKTEHYIDRPGFRVVRLQNIGHGDFRDKHRAYIDEARFNSLAKHQICPGDLVVAGLIDSSIRCCAIPSDIGPAIVKADCYRLAVHPLVSTGYVLHYLNSRIAHAFTAVHHHGLTLTRIGLGNFRSLLVPLPPLAEQHRIVARVEELRRLCAQLRERLTDARRMQSQLADALVAEIV